MANVQLQEYLSFLSWFQQAYPELNRQYWQQFVIPKDGEGVGLLEAGLNEVVIAELRQVKLEYYRLQAE